MKNNIKRLSKLFAVIAFFMALSCENDDSSPSVTITKVNPAVQYIQSTATLEGTGLDQVKYVFVGNFDAPFTVSEGVISFTIPAGVTPGTNNITLVVDNNYRVTSSIDVLVKPIPTISTITPSAAAAGQNVTINGTNLNNNPVIKVAGVNATVVSATATKLVFTVPTVTNNTISSTVALTTTFGTVSTTSTFYASKNLLLNSELELGTGDNFDNWGKYNGGSAMFATSVVGEAYSGRALKVTGFGEATNQWKTQFVSDLVTTTIGTKYFVYMWIKGTTAGGSMRFSTNESGGAQYGGDQNIGTTWQQVTFTFTGKSPQTRISLDMGAKAVTYIVDNITMVAQ
ncbi:IPT/TIG domain-containing protein [Flavobacterium fluvii]|uniref:IPT/TIG domain-containing protein n=1 Tax=Flavobacterium fluvii TaxID=468056 RepID=A0A1M5FV82_9FLAO|nr:IPT/TIG domain-containing protein [Flavobacterium fluvii]SHF95329.1 IPT/TIG domain-containing protein [Flavobacterium fluvii]